MGSGVRLQTPSGGPSMHGTCPGGPAAPQRHHPCPPRGRHSPGPRVRGAEEPVWHSLPLTAVPTAQERPHNLRTCREQGHPSLTISSRKARKSRRLSATVLVRAEAGDPGGSAHGTRPPGTPLSSCRTARASSQERPQRSVRCGWSLTLWGRALFPGLPRSTTSPTDRNKHVPPPRLPVGFQDSVRVRPTDAL